MKYINLKSYLHYLKWKPSQLKQIKIHRPCILTIGCSFTNWGAWTIKWDDPLHKSHGYPRKLAKLFSKGTIINAGLPGASSAVHVLFSKIIDFIEPQYVIYQLMDIRRNPQTKEELELYEDLGECNVCRWFYKHFMIFLRLCLKRSKERDNFSDINCDFFYISKIREIFTCPFLFLVNNSGYPYFREAEEVIQKLKKRPEVERLVITKFSGDHFRIGKKDYHPNELRQKLTALQIAPFIKL